MDGAFEGLKVDKLRGEDGEKDAQENYRGQGKADGDELECGVISKGRHADIISTSEKEDRGASEYG